MVTLEHAPPLPAKPPRRVRPPRPDALALSARAAPTREGSLRCPRCATPLKAPGDCPRCKAPADWVAENPRRPSPMAGFAATFDGIGYVIANPRLITWILLPLLVNTALFVWLVIWLDGGLAAFVPDFETEWSAWIDWLRVGMRDLGVATLLRWMCAIVGLLAAFLATLLLSGIVNAPFYDVLSERVESVFLGRKDPGRGWLALPADTFRSIGAALSLALRQLLVLGVLFLLSFVVVGAPLFAAAGFYFTGLALVDVTLSRKLYPARMRARWARRHLLSLMAVGLPVSFVPPLAPFGIVGATLMFLRDPDKP